MTLLRNGLISGSVTVPSNVGQVVIGNRELLAELNRIAAALAQVNDTLLKIELLLIGHIGQQK